MQLVPLPLGAGMPPAVGKKLKAIFAKKKNVRVVYNTKVGLHKQAECSFYARTSMSTHVPQCLRAYTHVAQWLLRVHGS
jgi:hypothetical protein